MVICLEKCPAGGGARARLIHEKNGGGGVFIGPRPEPLSILDQDLVSRSPI